ncbi:LysR family transcriptional regulator [Vibrio comitans]|uniref:Transcriptional regulator n=1 Tax=Vibrio comitans NBRC 102076 TaxID=1219078 RepID=A0A4Y3IU76_9VIBR|nr:LysR family transcriptional regulator [Vibrio comitans]GEA62290.1 transcriptional regulator [Vibrio comitans NBRC 102076]
MRTENLELFIRVVDLGSFAAVAKLLELPRANVSRRIAELEAELGIILFNRSTRHLSLTPLGQQFYKDTSRVVDAWTLALNNLTAATNAPSGCVKLGMPPSNDIRILSLIAEFQSRFPDIEVELHYTHNGYQDFHRVGLDIALHYGEVGASDLIAKKVATSTKKIIASPGFIERYGPPNVLQDLSVMPCACYRWPSGEVEDLWETNTGRVKVNRKIVTNNYDTLLKAIIDGMGVGYVPALLAQSALKNNEIVQILPGEELEASDAYIVYPKRDGLTLAHQLLVDYLNLEIPKLISSSRFS